MAEENNTPQFTEEDFFKYANEHYSEGIGKEISSIDDFKTVIEVEKEVVKEIQTVPDYLKGYDEFYKATNGRSMSDYVSAQKDWSTESEESKVAEYLKRTKPEYDKDDINTKISLLKERMEALDDDDANSFDVRAAKLEWKDLIGESQKFLSSETAKYKEKIPSQETQVNEGMELFKKQFADVVNSTESLKFGDLDYKVNKESLKGIESLEDITKLLVGDGTNMESTLKNIVFALNSEQILKDYLETGIVKHEDQRLKNMNNASQELHNTEPTGNEAEFWRKLSK